MLWQTAALHDDHLYEVPLLKLVKDFQPLGPACEEHRMGLQSNVSTVGAGNLCFCVGAVAGHAHGLQPSQP